MTTLENAAGWNTTALEEIRHNEDGRPVLFTNARILRSPQPAGRERRDPDPGQHR